MKINNILSVLSGAAVLLGAYACTDEVKYTPVCPMDVKGAQVYFSNDESTDIAIPADAGTIELPIYRNNTEGAVSVPLKSSVTDAAGEAVANVLTVPAQVSFEAGKAEAKIPVAVNFANVEASKDYIVNIAIDGADTTPYGLSQQTYTLSYAPWTEWEAYSETPYESVMGSPWTGEALTGIVQYRKSLVDPNLEQYAFPGPRYTNLYFTYIVSVDRSKTYEIDGVQCPQITMAPTDTHYDNGDKRIMYTDAFTWFKDIYGPINGKNYTDEQVNDLIKRNAGSFEYSYFNEKTGTFYLWLTPYVKADPLGRYGASYTILQLPGFANYDVSFSFLGNFVDPTGSESAIMQITRSNDINSFSYNVIPGALTEAEVEQACKDLAADADAELIYDQTYNVSVPVDGDATYTIVVVGYDSAGSQVYSTGYTFNVESVKKESDFAPAGTCVYTDGFLAIYGENLAGFQWENEIEEHKTISGYYRLVNPYRTFCEMAEVPEWADEGNYYLYINCSNPNACYLEESALGITLNPNDGSMLASSRAYNFLLGGNSLEAIAANGYCGSVVDGVLTFPTKPDSKGVERSVLLQGFTNEDGWYYAAGGKDFAVEFPDAAAQAKAPARKLAGKAQFRSFVENIQMINAFKAIATRNTRYKAVSNEDVRTLVLNRRLKSDF